MPAGVSVSGNMTSPCYADPAAADCQAFQRAEADWQLDLTSLCLAMPFMTSCTMWAECQPLQKAVDEATGLSKATNTLCSYQSLVASVCVEMPRMKGCEAWKALCVAKGSAVKQCTQNPPLPAMVPAEGIDVTPAGANNTTPMWTYDVKEAVDTICANEPGMEACANCTEAGRMFKNCPNPLETLSKLCAAKPDMAECAPLQEMCGEADVAKLWPELCAGKLVVPPFKPVFRSINITDPCYVDPTADACKTFARAHMEWMSDMTSLCNAMPFMVGCTLLADCKELIDTKNPATNKSMAFGTYCGMPSMVGSVCVDMGKMKGCEAYNALCKAEGTQVAGCKNPGVPSTLYTYNTYGVKDDVDAICATPEADQEALPEVPAQCANLTALCAEDKVAEVYNQVCIGDNASANATMGPAVPAPAPEAAPMASAAATAALVPAATLLLAVVAQLLLA
ncbi:hypothetical protein COHA_007141 [Chlorella ohadii]|uniref:Uncharacterized protein n=1 Tax=Chlorella ohadii TaxID=2649997 RepID=A0AAD5DMQ2_9CHLO|nr:hypothetical protein COHA_007141 [Chlorella ohadii]